MENLTLSSGLKLQTALNGTIEFLAWYKNYLIENEPTARQDINHIDYLLDSIPTNISEL